MSRRAKKIEKRVTFDPKYNSELVAHMIRVAMKDGKKSVAEKIVYGAIDKIKAHVERMCRSAMDDMCIQPAGMEELEVMLRKLAK